jgi:hypothetical protein
VRRSPLALLLVLALAAGLAACRPGERKAPTMRLWTDTYEFILSTDPVPPRARERTVYKVVVLDKETRQPVEGGEGQVFASSRDGRNIYDGLVAGPELGSYYGTLNYVTAGDWAVAVRFRRDSLKPLERADWMQSVRAARENF